MKRAAILAMLLGCSAPPRTEPEPERNRLDGFEEAAAKLASFRAWYELRDESSGEARLVEIAFRAPHTARVSFPGSHEILVSGGTLRFASEAYRYEVPLLDEWSRALERFDPVLKAAEAPRALAFSFDFADWDRAVALQAIRPQLGFAAGTLRFGWLRALRDPAFVFDGRDAFRREGDATRAAVEVLLEPHGLLSRARVLGGPAGHRGFTIELTRASFDPVPDDAFALPVSDALDQSPAAIEKLRGTLADLVEHAIVGALAARYGARWKDAPVERIRDIFAAYFRADLPRTYDPAAMAALVRQNQQKEFERARAEIARSADRASAKAYYIEKMRTLRAVSLDQIDALEEKIQENYGRFLVREVLRDLGASREFRDGMISISRQAMADVIREVLRDPVAAAFDGPLAELEKEPE
ncbi:MAG: hypothetical protein HYY17_06635 [Planctomycetes bacterium]|nr:hypothetical protein [Planctomycetota bacterium]